MGILDRVLELARTSREAVRAFDIATQQIDVPVPESLVNAALDRLGEKDLSRATKLKRLNVTVRDGSMDLNAEVTVKGVAVTASAALEIVKFNANLGADGRGALILRQQGPADVRGQSWMDKVVVEVARAFLSVLTGKSLEAWALGSTRGIDVVVNDGDHFLSPNKTTIYSFDLDTLGVRSYLANGLVGHVGAEDPAFRFGAESLLGLYAVTGAHCSEKTLVVKLARIAGIE